MDDAPTPAAPDEVQASTAEQQAPDAVRLDAAQQPFDDADPLKMAATTLSGDLRDFVLNMLDTHRSDKPMKRRPEAEQRKIIAEVTARCRESIEEVVRIIAVKGSATLTGTLEKVDVKGALKATITMSKSDPSRYQLIDAQGGDVLVALVDSRRFMGERAEATINPDQGDIERYAEEVNAANDAAQGDGEVHLIPPEQVPGALDPEEGAARDLETVAGAEVGFGEHVEEEGAGGALSEEAKTFTKREKKTPRRAPPPKASGPKGARGKRPPAATVN